MRMEKWFNGFFMVIYGMERVMAWMERKEDDFGDCLWLWHGKEKKEKLNPGHFEFLDSLTLCFFWALIKKEMKIK